MAARIILHGKQIQNQALRAAVARVREDGHLVDVRVTWEAGDARTLALEAARRGFERVIAGGGDGTVNEVLAGLLEGDFTGTMGILPLGTANDFARSARIREDLEEALCTAVTAYPVRVDVGLDRQEEDDHPFLNMATGGFGTEVTVETEPALKERLGGLAYLVTGVRRFGALRGERCRLATPEGHWEGSVLVVAIGNGRQAGGGHPICPDALIDDGLLEVSVLPFLDDMPAHETLGLLLGPNTLERLEDVILRWRVPWAEVTSDEPMNVNLDGEPLRRSHHRFEASEARVKLALPPDCPLVSGSGG